MVALGTEEIPQEECIHIYSIQTLKWVRMHVFRVVPEISSVAQSMHNMICKLRSVLLVRLSVSSFVSSFVSVGLPFDRIKHFSGNAAIQSRG